MLSAFVPANNVMARPRSSGVTSQGGGRSKPGNRKKNSSPAEARTCKSCRKVSNEVNDDMIVCERCEKFVCMVCAEILSSEYIIVQKSSHLHWFCSGCENAALTAVKEDRLIEEKCSALFSEFREKLEETFLTRLRDLESEISVLKERGVLEGTSKQPVNFKEIVQEEREASLRELSDRDRRKNNLVWFGIPESEKPEASDRMAEDNAFLKSVCIKALGIQVDITASRRLRSNQSNDNKTKRPLLVTVKDHTQVGHILKDARKLRDCEEFKQVYVKRDSTPLERVEMRRLISERDQKREETKSKGGSENWVIRSGKVVNLARRSREDQGGGEQN